MRQKDVQYLGDKIGAQLHLYKKWTLGVDFLYLEVVECRCTQIKTTFTVHRALQKSELLCHDFCAKLLGLK
jgi:hypothetical protein